MKKVLLMNIALFLSLCCLSATVPVSKTVGMVVLVPEGRTKIAKEAFTTPFSKEWFESFTTGDEVLALTYAPMLSEILPLENLIIGEEKNGVVKLRESDSMTVYSVFFDGDRIKALSVN